MNFTRQEKIAIIVFALTCFLFHFIVNLTTAYGFFRDELYYIACSDHLAWGYVDQPPLSLYILKFSRLIFGDSLAAIRIVPAVMHSLTLVMAAFVAKEMGGKIIAICIVCLILLLSPIHLGMSTIYSMNSIDILLWAIGIYLVIKIINTQQNKFWIWLGVVLGLGLLNKISVLFLGAGLAVAFIVTTERKWLTTRWPYIAAILASLLFLPYIFWNISNDLAHLEFIHNASSGKYSGRSPFDFVKEQFLFLNPLATPLWISGLLSLFFFKPLQKYKLIGITYLTAFAILLINRTSKGEYLAPAYICLMPAAGILIEQKIMSASLKWAGYAYLILLLLSACVLMPLVVPILSVEKYISYSQSLGIKPSSNESKKLSELPQFYADMFGWKEKARDVAKAFESLSPEEKKVCTIYSTNYGRCGAIDFFGKEYGLPKSIGSHNNYWIWGPGNTTGKVVIILGGSMEDHKDDFESVEEFGFSECMYCMPYENHVGIFIGRNFKADLSKVWKYDRHYD